MIRDLVLEIGVEEIPPQQLGELAEQLRVATQEGLREEHLPYQGLSLYYTPRRLTIFISGLDEQQSDAVEEIKGPPKVVAFDTQGRPTPAALGFCRSHDAKPEDLIVKALPEGEYCFLQARLAGRPTGEVLLTLLPKVIAKMTPRETMRWDDSGLRFIRPIRWLLCLYGDEAIDFSYGRLRAGRATRGHRTLGAAAIQVQDATDYFKKLKANGVILDQAERRAGIESALKMVSQEIKAHPVATDALLNEIANNLEHPTAVLGRYPDEFLSLPSEILATTLVEHQKFVPFAVGTKASPVFVGFRDGSADEAGTVRAGYERVVRARLTDSQFFFNLDRQTKMVERTRTLRSVVYQEKLGSMWDKVSRIRALAQLVAQRGGFGGRDTIDRAAFLCKADLLTAMVGEFPMLQGIVGGIYAQLEGEPAAVAQGIREHYQPRAQGDALPQSEPGMVVSLADKLDTLMGALLMGEEPTGSRDPFGLRRAANAVINIALGRTLDLDLFELIREAENLYHFIPDRRPLTVIVDFLNERLHQVLLQQYGIAYDLTDAVVAARDGNFARALQKARSLETIRSEERFRSLVMAFARVCHITRGQSANGFVPRLFALEAERDLWRAYLKAEGQVKRLLSARDYSGVVAQLIELSEPIDRYFDEVLVMESDRELRQNRLGFLQAIVTLFLTIGDLSKIVVEGEAKANGERPR